jgi:photosystem II stability/assembly factor-like uncharacterized protein
MKRAILLCALGLVITDGQAQKRKKKKEIVKSEVSYNNLNFRNVGPSLTAGRIADIAVNPKNPYEYYLAVASGGVWKTENAGTTFKPIFDNYGSYSIGCIALAPSNENIVWVGTGENNNQRSVAYGDGIYKSEDGGKSFKNMGLKNSEHIGKIVIHPTDPNIVYVAAYGPLWSEGGDRGLYKTTDGGENWEKVLDISEHTGISDIVMDPRNPDVFYVASHQRRRHVFTYIDGGPETAIYKTENGGESFKKLENGIPKADKGRIGLAISPANPDVVYAIIKASGKNGGFFKSTDRGASWTKQSSHQTSGNYYQELVCDPYDENKVFAMDTWLHHTEDGGKTFKKTGEHQKHVDNHCMWIDPQNTDHWIVGCDGGLYETWNHAQQWQFKPNLPITQFYKVSVDQAEPFYNIYGGTQDNNSMGGPSQTVNNAGILNSDWFITNGGDGFETQIDPKDPNIVYAQSQYGWLVRYDKKSGERIGIQPQPKKDEAAFRWNWDAPLLISPHNHKTLYFSANKVFKSTDQGNTWTAISGDLSRQEDRNKLPVMGRVWAMDAVMKNMSTSIYGNIVAFDESPLKQGLIYAGTDDGLIHVSENDGQTWTKYSKFPTVPEKTYVNMIVTSNYDASTVYAVFNNHKNGDFKPYILESKDKGKTWNPIQGNLPERGSVYSFAQDHKNKKLLFVGTEFGVHFSQDGGNKWQALKSGLPTIAVRDLAIQEREDDLVLGTFGRGFYVLDDYSPLREITKDIENEPLHIFDIPDGLLYVETNPLGLRGTGSQGASMYAAPNPKFGVHFDYYLKDKYQTKKDIREEKEAELKKSQADIAYPSLDELRAENREEKPYLLFVIKDKLGNVIRKIKETPKQGVNRLVWDLRMASTNPIKKKFTKPGRYSMPDVGPLVVPGQYQVDVMLYNQGEFSTLESGKAFEVKLLENRSLPAADYNSLLTFQNEVSELRRSMKGTSKIVGDCGNRLSYIQRAVEDYPSVPLDIMKEVNALNRQLEDVKLAFYGDGLRSQLQMETKSSVIGKVETIVYQLWNSGSEPTSTQKEQYNLAKEEYTPLLTQVKSILSQIEQIEEKLSLHNTPYTPGRGSNWKTE